MAESSPAPTHGSVCPWWLLYLFDNPLRRVVQRPERFLRPLVRSGDRCLDLGCGFGYFTLPMARLAGPSGIVIAVDLQTEMLARVRRRATRAGLASRIRLHQAAATGLQLDGKFDFALAHWMVHEVPDQSGFLTQVAAALLPGGRLALVEPRGHVGPTAFARTVALAVDVGLVRVRDLQTFFSRGVLLENSVGSAA
ncbi:MAG TPA: class I SAM-dependent methyltransferase [Steroidobacteraceae bacterium]|nr:class I SAM-dependent methyltransferase [Steroidobacteraceae bacterium]